MKATKKQISQMLLKITIDCFFRPEAFATFAVVADFLQDKGFSVERLDPASDGEVTARITQTLSENDLGKAKALLAQAIVMVNECNGTVVEHSLVSPVLH
jgi:hypothetical protein